MDKYDYLKSWYDEDVDVQRIIEAVNDKPGYKRYYLETSYEGEELSLVGVREETSEEEEERLAREEKYKKRQEEADRLKYLQLKQKYEK